MAPQTSVDVKVDSVKIWKFTRDCNCTDEYALDLLKRTNFDYEKAQRYHYLNESRAGSSASSKASDLTSDEGRFQLRHHSSRASSIHSDEFGVARKDEGPSKAPIQEFDNDSQLPNLPSLTDSEDESSHSANGFSANRTFVTSKRKQTTEWNFKLPSPQTSPTFRNALHESSPKVGADDEQFSLAVLAATLQGDDLLQEAKLYLQRHVEVAEKKINDEFEGFPLLFYAVASSNQHMVFLLLKHGAKADATHDMSGTPLLAFAIVQGGMVQEDTTSIVSLLLSYGASPQRIPPELFNPYNRNSSEVFISDSFEKDTTGLTKWCTRTAWHTVNEAANITHRYFLDRATKTRKSSAVRMQIAKMKKAERLLGVPYFLIGQSVATELLIKRLLMQLLKPSKSPLVLCFAGPSGHGKTELARQLGQLLSLDLEVVDCTVIDGEKELFGPRKPFVGSEEGSPVNNFLAQYSGQRSIVFLDEFEKTSPSIHQSLLLPFDNGEHRDRRNGKKIDCSKTIWIMATNALDNIILEFCQENEKILGDDMDEKMNLANELSRKLKAGFLSRFEAPLTGRVSEFIPFLPFSIGEQAVFTHRTLLELTKYLRKPVNLTEGPQEQLVGDIQLSIQNHATVCTALSKENYSRELGARSLKLGTRKVEDIILEECLGRDDEISEGGEKRDFVIDVHAGEVVGRVG